ncbi:AP2/ERF and B3 domain-containing transcription factor At1g50680-like isoform X1 [Salvia hispanica]|uniref:AP2/ERF and B3 domain-containing transcription factor At1g50680-like isoform X1 n=2 Tax=Salvia hispanica TaxID=49212 RepID=UPI002009B677|nr:AP2/ERF and B3 domain-containing transcription factor At1g50680-like isoform X1 [Salvia hispanica]
MKIFHIQHLLLVAGGRNLISQIMMQEASGVTRTLCGEISDSISSSHDQVPANQPMRYKGVVCQKEGRWGAQIYANGHRVWLGTFNSEKEAAVAYDRASMKLRSSPTFRNFPSNDNMNVSELRFQDQFSTKTVLRMIKDNSYASKLSDYMRGQVPQLPHVASLQDAPASRLRVLFEKELTPSDVGKLNRLVIPKKFAVKYFPIIPHANAGKEGSSVQDVELLFLDRSMRSWNIRYCYWKSSQSFVFTRGWNRFAKEKGLRSRDRVIFYSYEYGDQKFCILDAAYDDNRDRDGLVVDEDDEVLEMEKEGDESDRIEPENVQDKENEPSLSSKGFKLFGVTIV